MTSVSTLKPAFLSQFHVSFSSVVVHCIIIFCCFCSYYNFNQWLNWISGIPSQVVFFHPYTSITQLINSYPSKIIKTYPSSYFPAKIYPINTSLLGSSAPCIVINFLVLINHFYFHSLLFFNSFIPNASFLNPLKTSENLTVFWCFQAVEKGCIGNKWVNINNKQQQT